MHMSALIIIVLYYFAAPVAGPRHMEMDPVCCFYGLIPVMSKGSDWNDLAVSSGRSVKSGFCTDCCRENHLACLFTSRIRLLGCDRCIYRQHMFFIIFALVICNHSCEHVWIIIFFDPCEFYELPVVANCSGLFIGRIVAAAAGIVVLPAFLRTGRFLALMMDEVVSLSRDDPGILFDFSRAFSIREILPARIITLITGPISRVASFCACSVFCLCFRQLMLMILVGIQHLIIAAGFIIVTGLRLVRHLCCISIDFILQNGKGERILYFLNELLCSLISHLISRIFCCDLVLLISDRLHLYVSQFKRKSPVTIFIRSDNDRLTICFVTLHPLHCDAFRTFSCRVVIIIPVNLSIYHGRGCLVGIGDLETGDGILLTFNRLNTIAVP